VQVRYILTGFNEIAVELDYLLGLSSTILAGIQFWLTREPEVGYGGAVGFQITQLKPV
jgi:hypothetical protein